MTAARVLIPSSHHAASILVATPNELLRRRLGEQLRRVAVVEEAATGAEALSKLERIGARIAVLDRRFPDLNSEELISVVERHFPGTEVVMMNGESGAIELPEDAGDSPIYEWLREFSAQPVPDSSVIHSAPPPRSAPELLLPGMVGESEAMRELARLVHAVAIHSTSVLVCGETGSGKELVAESVHRLSPRADKPFVTVNCAAIPEALVEAELFGHTRGAFTGAVQSRLGKIHAAQGGTIFFDEIGELPLLSQSKLLRFLECGEVQRLGTSDVFRLDVRVVAATNVDLEKRVEQGLFREDLYYRLSVFPLELPPLRQRICDVALIARHFLERLAGGNALTFTPETVARLEAHHWPGNVRELRNVVERAFVLAYGGQAIGPEHIHMRKPCASVRPTSENS